MCCYSFTALYLGTRIFIIHHATRYAIPQKQNMIKYPAGLPLNPKKVNASPAVCAKVNRLPAARCTNIDPIPPAMAPIPVMVATVCLGNMSPMVEKRLADHAWCPVQRNGICTARYSPEQYSGDFSDLW